jgi:adenylate kinase
MKLIILGPAGAGKGTQSEFIENQYKIAHISTGDIFRANLRGNTELGNKAKEYMDKGLLVPDELTVSMVIDRIAAPDCENGYLLDGFPRNIAQADALDENGEKLDAVIAIEVDNELLIDRITGRRVCPNCGSAYHIRNLPPKVEGICDKCGSELVHRSDDSEETARARFNEYDEKTKPLLAYYTEKNILKRVDGQKPIEDVQKDIAEILNELR